MNLELDDEETDGLLVAAADKHLIDFVKETQPATSPQILSTVARTLTEDADAGTRGMAPLEESRGELREGEGQCLGLSPVDTSQSAIYNYDKNLCETKKFQTQESALLHVR